MPKDCIWKKLIKDPNSTSGIDMRKRDLKCAECEVRCRYYFPCLSVSAKEVYRDERKATIPRVSIGKGEDSNTESPKDTRDSKDKPSD